MSETLLTILVAALTGGIGAQVVNLILGWRTAKLEREKMSIDRNRLAIEIFNRKLAVLDVSQTALAEIGQTLGMQPGEEIDPRQLPLLAVEYYRASVPMAERAIPYLADVAESERLQQKSRRLRDSIAYVGMLRQGQIQSRADWTGPEDVYEPGHLFQQASFFPNEVRDRIAEEVRRTYRLIEELSGVAGIGEER